MLSKLQIIILYIHSRNNFASIKLGMCSKIIIEVIAMLVPSLLSKQ